MPSISNTIASGKPSMVNASSQEEPSGFGGGQPPWFGVSTKLMSKVSDAGPSNSGDVMLNSDIRSKVCSVVAGDGNIKFLWVIIPVSTHAPPVIKVPDNDTISKPLGPTPPLLNQSTVL